MFLFCRTKASPGFDVFRPGRPIEPVTIEGETTLIEGLKYHEVVDKVVNFAD